MVLISSIIETVYKWLNCYYRKDLFIFLLIYIYLIHYLLHSIQNIEDQKIYCRYPHQRIYDLSEISICLLNHKDRERMRPKIKGIFLENLLNPINLIMIDGNENNNHTMAK